MIITSAPIALAAILRDLNQPRTPYKQQEPIMWTSKISTVNLEDLPEETKEKLYEKLKIHYETEEEATEYNEHYVIDTSKNYWYINRFWDVQPVGDKEFINRLYDKGELYRTKEDAEYQLAYLTIEQRLRRFSKYHNDLRGNDIDRPCMYYIYCRKNEGEIVILQDYTYKDDYCVEHDENLFVAKEDAEAAIKFFGDDLLTYTTYTGNPCVV